jgi:hypothetical protein
MAFNLGHMLHEVRPGLPPSKPRACSMPGMPGATRVMWIEPVAHKLAAVDVEDS